MASYRQVQATYLEERRRVSVLLTPDAQTARSEVDKMSLDRGTALALEAGEV